MMTALPIRPLIASPILLAKRNPSVATKGGDGAGLLQVLGNPSDLKFAATIALVFFVASLAVAPAPTPDQKTLAAEINSKTLKAASTIERISGPPTNRAQLGLKEIPSGLRKGGFGYR